MPNSGELPAHMEQEREQLVLATQYPWEQAGMTLEEWVETDVDYSYEPR